MTKLLGVCAIAVMSLAEIPALGNFYLVPADSSFGPGTLTVDTRTGLTWLDLSISEDMSYLQASAAMAAGGQFAGFRHATVSEVVSLYSSAGFSEGFIPASDPSFDNVTSLISLVGPTDVNSARGITGTPASGDSVLLAYINLASSSGTPGYIVKANPPTTAYGLDTHYPTVGNWLVVVPEPSCWGLLFLAALLRFRASHGRH